MVQRVYDARTNVPRITKKDRPLTTEYLKECEECYGSDSNGRAKRKSLDSKEDRWRSFTASIPRSRRRHRHHALTPYQGAPALVNEGYLRRVEQPANWQNRPNFFGVAVRLMRPILVVPEFSWALTRTELPPLQTASC